MAKIKCDGCGRDVEEIDFDSILQTFADGRFTFRCPCGHVLVGEKKEKALCRLSI